MSTTYILTKEEKETCVLYNQTQEPITIWGYDPNLGRRLAAFAAKHPETCRRIDPRKYPDYYEYEIDKRLVSIRLLPPATAQQKQIASERAKHQGLGRKIKEPKTE